MSGGNKSGVYTHEMTDEDHIALCKGFREVQGMVVISGYPNRIYDEILSDWEAITMDARALQNLPRMERLWLSPAATAALHPRLAL